MSIRMRPLDDVSLHVALNRFMKGNPLYVAGEKRMMLTVRSASAISASARKFGQSVSTALPFN
jgi:hypothetical protein